jgi:hypothetical protein
MNTPKRDITVRYSSVDHFSKTRKFKTLAGAQKYAQEWVDLHPDIGLGYAVSFDGIGKIEVQGATLEELFPPEIDAFPKTSEEYLNYGG